MNKDRVDIELLVTSSKTADGKFSVALDEEEIAVIISNCRSSVLLLSTMLTLVDGRQTVAELLMEEMKMHERLQKKLEQLK